MEIQISPEVTLLLTPAAELILKTIVAVVFAVPGAVPFAEAVTAILKRVPFLRNVGAQVILLAVGVLTWVGFLVATQFGYADIFTNAIDTLTTLIAGAAGLTLTLKYAPQLYEGAKARGVPVFGYARTEG